MLPPSIDVAKAKNIINRWNPPNKRFLYLSASFEDKPFDGILSYDEKVCCEELRLVYGQEVTFADFYHTNLVETKMILNLNYEGITIPEIDERFYSGARYIVDEIARPYIEKKVRPSEDEVRKQINEKMQRDKKIHDANVHIYVAQSFLKLLTETIFVPIDDGKTSSVTDLDTCYHSFHKLAELLEKYGIAGILYPSTRMNLINKTGTNLVLFNVDDAIPDGSSLRDRVYRKKVII